MNKKRDYRVVYYDWKEEAPVGDIIRYGRKYKNFFQLPHDDGNFIIFSDFKVKSEAQCEELIFLEQSAVSFPGLH